MQDYEEEMDTDEIDDEDAYEIEDTEEIQSKKSDKTKSKKNNKSSLEEKLNNLEDLEEESEDEEEEQFTRKKKKNNKRKNKKDLEENNIDFGKEIHLDLNKDSKKDKKKKKNKVKDLVEILNSIDVSELDLDEDVIRDLRTSGYKTVGDVINDGPEKLAEGLVIDPEEVINVAKAIDNLSKKVQKDE
ncbi:MAG: hypothetical protein Q9M91_04930 [Candidatus Dojkabacteria bacterium]|nr:hypothetical protein [Candidatus Dojkabacteria bacterium]